MTRKKTHAEFLNEVNDKFGNIFIFNSEYVGAKIPVSFICRYCNYSHNCQPTNILNNMVGCSNYLCEKYKGKREKINPIHYIELLKSSHGESISIINPEVIVNAKTRVNLICNNCEFTWENCINHLVHGSRKTGCPNCNKTSSLEKVVKNFLDCSEISYIREYRIITTGSYRPRYDFYLPEYNAVIEVHGMQHYMPIEFFGGDKSFIRCVKNDFVKEQICKDRDIKYIEISYKDIENNEYEKILKDSIFNDYPEGEYT